MSKVGGVGSTPPPERKPDKKSKEKSKDAPRFADVMKKKFPGTKGGPIDPQAGKKGNMGGGTTKGERLLGQGKKGVDEQQTARGEREGVEIKETETTKTEARKDETGQAVQGQVQQTASVNEVKQVQAAKPPGLPPEMVQKIVETVRIGQNRVGATEMQIGLKSTVFEGMNLKVSTKDGIVSIVMEVEQMVAKDQLEAELTKLQDRLEDQGLAVGDIQVSLKNAGGSSGDSGGGDSDELGDQGVAPPGGVTPGATGPADENQPKKKPDTRTDYTL